MRKSKPAGLVTTLLCAIQPALADNIQKHDASAHSLEKRDAICSSFKDKAAYVDHVKGTIQLSLDILKSEPRAMEEVAELIESPTASPIRVQQALETIKTSHWHIVETLQKRYEHLQEVITEKDLCGRE